MINNVCVYGPTTDNLTYTCRPIRVSGSSVTIGNNVSIPLVHTISPPSIMSYSRTATIIQISNTIAVMFYASFINLVNYGDLSSWYNAQIKYHVLSISNNSISVGPAKMFSDILQGFQHIATSGFNSIQTLILYIPTSTYTSSTYFISFNSVDNTVSTISSNHDNTNQLSFDEVTRSGSISVSGRILKCYRHTNGYMYAQVGNNTPVQLTNVVVIGINLIKISETQVLVIYRTVTGMYQYDSSIIHSMILSTV